MFGCQESRICFPYQIVRVNSKPSINRCSADAHGNRRLVLLNLETCFLQFGTHAFPQGPGSVPIAFGQYNQELVSTYAPDGIVVP